MPVIPENVSIARKIGELLAADAGVLPDNRLYSRYLEQGWDPIHEWYRHPNREPATEIDRLCQTAVRNYEDAKCRKAEAANQVMDLARSKRLVDDPTLIKIVVKDEASGRRLRLTLPVSSVETSW